VTINYLHWGVARLCPQYSPLYDCVVQSGPDGPEITLWNETTLGSRPTDEALEASGREYYEQVQAEKAADESERQIVQTSLAALQAGTATPAQIQAALAYVVRKLSSS